LYIFQSHAQLHAQLLVLGFIILNSLPIVIPNLYARGAVYDSTRMASMPITIMTAKVQKFLTNTPTHVNAPNRVDGVFVLLGP
jgi:hypothetical protein